LVVFDWDEEGFRNFVSDPDMAAIFELLRQPDGF